VIGWHRCEPDGRLQLPSGSDPQHGEEPCYWY
jgi:hypothetical protein